MFSRFTHVVASVRIQFSSVQLLSRVRRFVTPWTAARQASLSIANSWSLLKLMSIESVMPSNHLILCCPLLLLPPNPSQHQSLFQWVSSSHQVAKVLELQLQHQSFQWIVSFQFSRSIMSDSVTPWTAAHQASLSITNSQSLFKPMSIKSMMSSNHVILCCPLLLLPSIFPSIRVFSNESVLHIRWPKYWSLSFSMSPSNEYSGLISYKQGGRSQWPIECGLGQTQDVNSDVAREDAGGYTEKCSQIRVCARVSVSLLSQLRGPRSNDPRSSE